MNLEHNQEQEKLNYFFIEPTTLGDKELLDALNKQLSELEEKMNRSMTGSPSLFDMEKVLLLQTHENEAVRNAARNLFIKSSEASFLGARTAIEHFYNLDEQDPNNESIVPVIMLARECFPLLIPHNSEEVFHAKREYINNDARAAVEKLLEKQAIMLANGTIVKDI